MWKERESLVHERTIWTFEIYRTIQYQTTQLNHLGIYHQRPAIAARNVYYQNLYVCDEIAMSYGRGNVFLSTKFRWLMTRLISPVLALERAGQGIPIIPISGYNLPSVLPHLIIIISCYDEITFCLHCCTFRVFKCFSHTYPKISYLQKLEEM